MMNNWLKKIFGTLYHILWCEKQKSNFGLKISQINTLKCENDETVNDENKIIKSMKTVKINQN